jgi:hypothetical protein
VADGALGFPPDLAVAVLASSTTGHAPILARGPPTLRSTGFNVSTGAI